jgi:hypothetical protein
LEVPEAEGSQGKNALTSSVKNNTGGAS